MFRYLGEGRTEKQKGSKEGSEGGREEDREEGMKKGRGGKDR